MDIDFTKYNAGSDKPDERDIRADDILDMAIDLPSSLILDHTAPLNQGSI